MKLDYSNKAAPLYHQIKEFLLNKIKNNKIYSEIMVPESDLFPLEP